MKIGIIGGGFMGEAIIKGMLNTNQFKPNDISVIEIDTEKINQLKKYNLDTEIIVVEWNPPKNRPKLSSQLSNKYYL